MEIASINPYLLILSAGLVGAIGDSFLNQYADRGGIGWLLGGYAIWILTASLFTFLLKGEVFAKGVILFLLANIIFAIIIGRFYLGEHFSGKQWLGIALGIIAVGLMRATK